MKSPPEKRDDGKLGRPTKWRNHAQHTPICAGFLRNKKYNANFMKF